MNNFFAFDWKVVCVFKSPQIENHFISVRAYRFRFRSKHFSSLGSGLTIDSVLEIT